MQGFIWLAGFSTTSVSNSQSIKVLSTVPSSDTRKEFLSLAVDRGFPLQMIFPSLLFPRHAPFHSYPFELSQQLHLVPGAGVPQGW